MPSPRCTRWAKFKPAQNEPCRRAPKSPLQRVVHNSTDPEAAEGNLPKFPQAVSDGLVQHSGQVTLQWDVGMVGNKAQKSGAACRCRTRRSTTRARKEQAHLALGQTIDTRQGRPGLPTGEVQARAERATPSSGRLKRPKPVTTKRETRRGPPLKAQTLACVAPHEWFLLRPSQAQSQRAMVGAAKLVLMLVAITRCSWVIPRCPECANVAYACAIALQGFVFADPTHARRSGGQDQGHKPPHHVASTRGNAHGLWRTVAYGNRLAANNVVVDPKIVRNTVAACLPVGRPHTASACNATCTRQVGQGWRAATATSASRPTLGRKVAYLPCVRKRMRVCVPCNFYLQPRFPRGGC